MSEFQSYSIKIKRLKNSKILIFFFGHSVWEKNPSRKTTSLASLFSFYEYFNDSKMPKFYFSFQGCHLGLHIPDPSLDPGRKTF